MEVTVVAHLFQVYVSLGWETRRAHNILLQIHQDSIQSKLNISRIVLKSSCTMNSKLFAEPVNYLSVVHYRDIGFPLNTTNLSPLINVHFSTFNGDLQATYEKGFGDVKVYFNNIMVEDVRIGEK